MPVHHCIVFIASSVYLISEFRVLLGNPNLFLQPLLLVVELSETILKHLRLDLLLLHVELLAELARAVQARDSPVRILCLVQVVELDISEAKVMADELLLSNLFGPSIEISSVMILTDSSENQGM